MKNKPIPALSIMRKSTIGFTLIELMITVVIIGVLAAIAYPSYRNHLIQTRRSDAQIALTQAASQQERFFTECNTYASSLASTRSCGAGTLGYGTASPESHYTLSMGAAGPINTTNCSAFSCGYNIIATPVVGGPQANDGKFRIDSTGVKQWDKANNDTYSSRWTDK